MRANSLVPVMAATSASPGGSQCWGMPSNWRRIVFGLGSPGAAHRYLKARRAAASVVAEAKTQLKGDYKEGLLLCLKEILANHWPLSYRKRGLAQTVFWGYCQVGGSGETPPYSCQRLLCCSLAAGCQERMRCLRLHTFMGCLGCIPLHFHDDVGHSTIFGVPDWGCLPKLSLYNQSEKCVRILKV